MRISTWITSLYICGLISVNQVVGEAIVFLYGGNYTLHCGGGPPAVWFHNGLSTGVNSNTYTITNADFSNDGEYQCRRGGVDVLPTPLKIIVYGRGNITALNCSSTSNNGGCVRNAIRGQPVTLCVAFTTIPPLIPEGKRVSNLSGSVWYFKNREDPVLLYSCTTSSCEPGPSLNLSLYTYFNISCLTINDVQENQQYEMSAFFDPSHSPRPSVIFSVTYEESPVANISANQGEILCSTQDSTPYPGDRYCLYVEDSGGERHEVECDDLPVSTSVEKLMKLGNTVVCTVKRTILDSPVYNDATYEIPGYPVANISVNQGEILCSTQDSTTYPGDRYCLYVEDSGGERHEVECDDRPVSGDVKKLKKLGNTAMCTVNRTILDPPVYNDTTYKIPATPPESPSPVGDTDDAIVVPVSVAVVAVAIIVTIAVVITVTIIVVKYKHLKCATNPTQSDIFSKNLL